ncbi:hypothetical protein QVD17_14884 [Tagetes erecta]|uniref:TORTIFOLIA1/SINE1-2 N-terminal domain-containing protein n=1 Tax=Tagetes erecta TaxID=13708 RepID=A0AAD8KN91_TARER|nr:hypothetical protein QVD17_14884 [Tagetes erecta]
MGKNLSQLIRLEFENLDKDLETRNLAMKTLTSYVKDLDSNTIRLFVARVSETKETGLTSGAYAVTLYEDIARVHGIIIVPYIDNIMLNIIKTLSCSTRSFGAHQACSKVVCAIVRYGMDPTTPDGEKQDIMHSLCKPLSDSLLARGEWLSSGAAFCLKEIVEFDNWRFCSSQMVNEVCQRVVAALEMSMQGDSHMGLVMALTKHNSLVLEGYARLLVQAGVRVLNVGHITEGDCQKQLLAIQMIISLMWSLHYKCMMSELAFLIEELQKFENDQMEDVKEAAYEAIQTAKRILWSNGDVSLKDGLFSGDQMSDPRSAIESSETREDHEDGFLGFLHRRPVNGDPRRATPSPQRSRSYVNLVNSLHVPASEFSKSQSKRLRNADSSYDCNGFNESFTDIATNESNSLQQPEELVTDTQLFVTCGYAILTKVTTAYPPNFDLQQKLKNEPLHIYSDAYSVWLSELIGLGYLGFCQPPIDL